MAASAGHDSVINFAPVAHFMADKTGFVDPTGEGAGEYFSRIISWYTKGGFVDGKVPRLCSSPAILLGSIDYCQLIGNRLSEFGVKHVSNLSYDWKYWEVLNEVTP